MSVLGTATVYIHTSTGVGMCTSDWSDRSHTRMCGSGTMQCGSGSGTKHTAELTHISETIRSRSFSKKALQLAVSNPRSGSGSQQKGMTANQRLLPKVCTVGVPFWCPFTPLWSDSLESGVGGGCGGEEASRLQWPRTLTFPQTLCAVCA